MSVETSVRADSVADDVTTRPRITAIQLKKRYGFRTVVRDVSLSVSRGECVAMFGPNGAGKTTLIRLVSTLTRPQGGTLFINGYDAVEDPTSARREIGVVAHQPYVYDSLTARENLQFFARMFEVSAPHQRIQKVLQDVELADRADDLVGTYSRGMLQRIALARAILHKPSVLLLDEPDTGLDPASVRLLEAILAEHCLGGGSVLMTTHNLDFGLKVSDRTMVLVRGQIEIDSDSQVVDASSIEAIMGAPGA